jgi:hypothetical protein
LDRIGDDARGNDGTKHSTAREEKTAQDNPGEKERKDVARKTS